MNSRIPEAALPMGVLDGVFFLGRVILSIVPLCHGQSDEQGCAVACRLTSGSSACDTVLQPAALPQGQACFAVLPFLQPGLLELEGASRAMEGVSDRSADSLRQESLGALCSQGYHLVQVAQEEAHRQVIDPVQAQAGHDHCRRSSASARACLRNAPGSVLLQMAQGDSCTCKRHNGQSSCWEESSQSMLCSRKGSMSSSPCTHWTCAEKGRVLRDFQR